MGRLLALPLVTRHSGWVSQVEFDPSDRSITVGPWRRRATWIRAHSPEDDPRSPRFSALVGVRRGVNLLVEVDSDRGVLWLEAWSGEPYESDGLAVVSKQDHLAGVARIPICGCGDRGCGNAGVQLAFHAAPKVLPVIAQLLEDLPDLAVVPKRGHTWTGSPPYTGL